MVNAIETTATINGMEIYIGEKTIKSKIATFAKMGAKWQEEFKKLTISCVHHVKEHGDNTLLLALHNALPSGAKKEAFLEYCKNFAGIKAVNTEDKLTKVKKLTFKKDKEVTADMVTAATTVDPLDYKRARPAATTVDPLDYKRARPAATDNAFKFDVLDLLNNLFKKHEDASDKLKKGEAVIENVHLLPADLYKQLGQVRAMYEEQRKKTDADKAIAAVPATIVKKEDVKPRTKAEQPVNPAHEAFRKAMKAEGKGKAKPADAANPAPTAN